MSAAGDDGEVEKVKRCRQGVRSSDEGFIETKVLLGRALVQLTTFIMQVLYL